ncbi:MAG: SHOCT domain-containing protein [Deltaproteobacteria bacterium]|nr:SHOCT domain-containing protein [Deltaproteobacteria bacterium]
MNFKKIIYLFFCFFLTACATRINHPPAPLQQQSTVERFQLDENESRVHFFLGEFFMKNARGIQLNETADFYVNNVKIGMIGNNKEYIAVDLHPGLYSFKWMPTSTGSGYCEPEPLQLSIASGELIFMKANMRDVTSNLAYMFGPVGALAGVRLITYFEQDTNLKNNIHEYKLTLLNEDIKKSLSIKKMEPEQSVTESAASNDVEKKLSELKKIYENGLITKEEYDIKRKELINKL